MMLKPTLFVTTSMIIPLAFLSFKFQAVSCALSIFSVHPQVPYPSLSGTTNTLFTVSTNQNQNHQTSQLIKPSYLQPSQIASK